MPELTFRCIPPVAITDAKLTSSTVPEPDTASGEDPAVWNAATNYNLGDLVTRTGVHGVYENIQAGTDATAPENAPTRWTFVRYTNRWRSLKLDRSLPTIAASPYVVEITPGQRCDAWFVGGVVADSVTVTVTVGVDELYSETFSMTRRNTVSWSDYFFGGFDNKPANIGFELPLSASAVIKFEFVRDAGDIQVSSIAVGRSVLIGYTLYDAESDDLNFSRIDREFDGTAVLVPRRSIIKTRQDVWSPVELLPGIRKVKQETNATPAVWSALGDFSDNFYFDSFLILGIYREFKVNAPFEDVATLQIELEEV